MHIRDIRSQHIEQYKSECLAQGVSRKTVNNRLSILRKCLTTAYDWLSLDGTPPRFAWLKCPPPKTDYLSDADCATLLSRSGGVLHEMILMALRTGMRQWELRGLQWQSIDWQNRSVVVRHSRCDYTKSLGSPKNGRERHIPLDDEVFAILAKRMRRSGNVFLDDSGKVFARDRIANNLAKLCEVAGIRRFGWHVFRHTFASHLVMRGVPLSAVQMLMGHATITMTMRYTHLNASTLRAAISLLSGNRQPDPKFWQPVGNA